MKTNLFFLERKTFQRL